MAKFIPIEAVPRDFDADKPKGLFNPLKVPFTHSYAGKSITVQPGQFFSTTEPIAFHLAKHLAEKILHEGLNQELLEQFPGDTEQGRPKWKVQQNKFISKTDLLELRNQLVFDIVVNETVAPIDPVVPAYAEKSPNLARKPRKKKVEAKPAEPKEEDAGDDDEEKSEE